MIVLHRIAYFSPRFAISWKTRIPFFSPGRCSYPQWGNKGKAETTEHHRALSHFDRHATVAKRPRTEHFYRIKRIKYSQVTTAAEEIGQHAGKHTTGTASCPSTSAIVQLLPPCLEPVPLGGTMELQCGAPTAVRKAATAINPLFTCCCSSLSMRRWFISVVGSYSKESLKTS